MQRKRTGFTLVELLVVIGIIALLISILLPSLNKARQQANTVACESTMRQVYNYMMLYANDFRGYTMPCVMQIPGREYDWYSPQLLGYEYGRTFNNNSGTDTNNVQLLLNSQLLRCPSQDRSQDPPVDATLSFDAYYGDYLYNQSLGTRKVDAAGNETFTYPYVRISQTPGNVLAMVESNKPNYPAYTGYKPYFDTYAHLTTPQSGGTLPRVGTPHFKNKKCNALFMDGHIMTIDPYADLLNKDYLINQPQWNKFRTGLY